MQVGDRRGLVQARRSILLAVLLFALLSASLLSVTAASAAEGGTIAGHVKSAATEAGIAGIEVCAYYEEFEQFEGFSEYFEGGEYYEHCGTTTSGGAYSLTGLAPGAYYVGFATPSNSSLNYRRQFFSGKARLYEGQYVSVSAGATTSGVDASMQQGGQISGTTTDSASKAAVAGISVCVTERGGEYFRHCATTNASGEYTVSGLNTAQYNVEFAQPEESSLNYRTQFYSGKASESEAGAVSVTAGSTTTGINAALLGGGIITGTVTDAVTKAGISGIQVCSYASTSRCVHTGAGGNYTISGLGSGGYTVSYFAPEASALNYLSQSTEAVKVTSGETTSGTNAALQHGGEITGTVTNAATKAAVKGIQVCSYECATTDASGKYTIERLPTGSYQVSFAAPYYSAALNYVSQYYNGVASSSEATSVSVTAGSVSGGVNAALQEAGKISGTVTDAATKAAIANIEVCARSESPFIYRCAITNSGGGYGIGHLPSASYKVQFAVAGFGYGFNRSYVSQYYSGKATFAEATPVSVTLGTAATSVNAALVEGGKITGTITNAATKAPISGAQVCVYTLSEEFSEECAVTNSAGEYTAAGLAAGEYKLYFYGGAGYADDYYNGKTSFGEADPVSVTLGKTTSGINAALQPGGTIRGTVTSAVSKAPVESVEVCALTTSGGYTRCGYTNSSGEYAIEGLIAGEYKVQFARFYYLDNFVTQYYHGKTSLSEAEAVTVTSGGTTSAINAELVEAAKITGTVTNASTKAPIEGIEVCAGGAVTGCAFTGAGGEYTITQLQTGSYTVTFYTFGKNYIQQYYNGTPTYSEATPVSATAGSTTSGINAALKEGGTISGTVTNAATKTALPNVEACVSPIEGTEFNNEPCVNTNASGEYTLVGLRTGNYIVYFYGGAQNYVTRYYNEKNSSSEADHVAVTAGTGKTAINGAMHEGGTIKGRVTNAATEAPLASESVCAMSAEFTSSSCGSTNSAGEYTITGLEAGKYKVYFYSTSGFAAQYYNNKPNYSEADSVTVTVGGTAAAINAAMGTAGSVTGTVTDAATKAGIAGIQVCARRSTGEFVGGCVNSGSGGKYTISGLPAGEYVAEFRPGSGSTSNYAAQYYKGVPAFSEATRVSITNGSTTSGIDAAMLEGGEVSGIVTDAATKAALSGATVCAVETLGEAGERCATTNGKGEYVVTSISPGKYRVRVSSSSGEYATQYWGGATSFGAAQFVAVTDGVNVEGLNVALLAGGKISGVVTSAATKAPIAGIQACAGEGCAVTNSSGEYTIIGLGAGEYTVAFSGNALNYLTQYYKEKAHAGEATKVAVTPHETTSAINASMLGGGQITGTVTDSASKVALSGASVCTSGPASYCASTNSSGEYTISGLPTGSYTVSFSDTGASYIGQYYNGKASAGEANPVPVTTGSVTGSINAALVKGARVTGTVTRAATKTPLAHVLVCAQRHGGGGEGCASTSFSGEYSIAGVPGGEYTVSFNGSSIGYVNQYYNGRAGAGEANLVTLTAGATSSGINAALEEGGKISGKVTDASTKSPVPGLEVYIYGAGSEPVTAAVTNPSGEYATEYLLPGTYKVEFFSTAEAYATQFYNAKTEASKANPVAVTGAGHVTPNINAELAPAGPPPGPRISGLSPNRGPESGGNTVHINGTGLGGASAVSFGGTPAASFTVESTHSIRATAPAGVKSTIDLRVTTGQGSSPIVEADRYRYLTPEEVELEEAAAEAAAGKATVTGVSPTAVLDTGGETVTITGNNYEGVKAVTFGGEPAESFEVNSSSKITAVVPFTRIKACGAQVTTATGTSAVRGLNALACVPPSETGPAVTGISPKKGPRTGGTKVTVSGTRFSGITGVLVGGARATQISLLSETSLSVIVPAHAEGSADVQVATANGSTSITSKDRFKYGKPPAPSVTYVGPTAGPKAGGTEVTVGGTNFATGMTFLFGKLPASVLSCIATSCNVTAPAAAKTGAIDVIAVNGKSKSKKGTADRFTYE
jgi:hypothetical protein